jgi:hypothetical protein
MHHTIIRNPKWLPLCMEVLTILLNEKGFVISKFSCES